MSYLQTTDPHSSSDPTPLQQLEETIKSELINFGAKVVGITGANALNGPELTAIITAAQAYALAIAKEVQDDTIKSCNNGDQLKDLKDYTR